VISIFRFFWCIFTDPLLRPVHFPVQYVTLPKLHCSLRAFLLWLCHWPIIHSWEWWRSGRAQGQRPPYSYSAGQPKPALHPKFSENPDMLNYRQLRKNFKNNFSGNSADNPFKSLQYLLFYSHFIGQSKIVDWNPVAEGCLIRLGNIPNSGSNHNNDFLYDLMSNQKP